VDSDEGGVGGTVLSFYAEDWKRKTILSTEGFTLVLAGLKALLEHNIILNLVPDRFPDAHVKP
jgi:hypothetical protein